MDRGFPIAETEAVEADALAISPLEEFGPLLLSLVDGEPLDGNGPILLGVNPATGEPSARVACAAEEEIDAAVESAVLASALWRCSSFEERSKKLAALARLIRDQSREIAELIAREQGKPVQEALALEVLPALDHLGFLIRHAEHYHAGTALDARHRLYAHKRAHYFYDPLGVIALVTPSPLPFALPLIQVAAALAMGNAVVLKPSETTPATGLRVGELCLAAGFPAGLVNVVQALPEETLHLCAHPRADKVFFTGSLAAGQQVMATAACAPRPVVLQLGGKHPAIVAGDADVDHAARGVVWGALANCGQNCGAVERVYVEERIAARLLDRIVQEVDRLRVGNPLEQQVDLGPLVSEERRQEVHRQVEEAVQHGARLLRGGTIPDGPGFFYPPTVLLGPPGDCSLMVEETLGPVIPIVVVESLERAILLANDSEYALTASGWTRSQENADRLMVGLQAGVVTINDVLYSFGEPAATWSGFRKSGVGHSHGSAGLREMCRQRFVSFEAAPSEAPVFSFPYDEGGEAMTQAAIRYLHGKSRFARLLGLMRLAGSKRFRARIPFRSFLWGTRQGK